VRVTKSYLPGRSVRSPQATKIIATLGWLAFVAVGVYFRRLFAGTDVESLWWVWIAIPGAAVAWSRHAVKRYNADALPAIQALQLGQPARAEQLLTALREKTRWPRSFRNLTTYNLGVSIHRQGRHAEAIAMMIEADRAGGATTVNGAIASSLALFHAVLGDLEQARTWFAEATKRYRQFPAAVPFPQLLSEIAIAVRAGQSEEICRRLARDWTQIESTTKGETLRPIRVLRAFATAQTSGVRDAAALTPLVAALHPARAADFAYLATSWPELDMFLRTALP
jgi:hypothetical protein